MNLSELKEALHDVAASFFVGATVIWAEQAATLPKLPYLTLKIGSLQRTAFPITDQDGIRYYPCQTTAEWNLYTKGKQIQEDSEKEAIYINTATSDLMDFFNFLESEEITDRLSAAGITISLLPPIRDLTGLQNDSQYRYRAMAEATVSYAQEAGGLYGLGGVPDVPNASGGGSQELAEAETSSIEEIELAEELELEDREPEALEPETLEPEG